MAELGSVGAAASRRTECADRALGAAIPPPAPPNRPRRRSLATLRAQQPGAWPGATGGRDSWSAPIAEPPGAEDRVAALWTALGEVTDPELPISLVDLGLVYGVAFDQGTARIDLTFTATACPCMAFIKEDVTDRLASEPWVRAVEIREVWDPPWTTSRISERGKDQLRAFGVGA